MMPPEREGDAEPFLAGSPALALYTTALALLLAMRAADEVTPGKANKTELRRIARQLKIGSVLVPR